MKKLLINVKYCLNQKSLLYSLLVYTFWGGDPWLFEGIFFGLIGRERKTQASSSNVVFLVLLLCSNFFFQFSLHSVEREKKKKRTYKNKSH